MLRRLLLLLLDVVLSAGIVFIVSLAEAVLFASLPNSLVFAAMFASPLLLIPLGLACAPFLAIPLYGLVKGRYGFLLGPIVLAGAIYLHSSWRVQQDEDALVEMAVTRQQPDKQNHALLAIESSKSYEDASIRVLATSAHEVALKSTGYGRIDWTLYRPADGAACLAPENAVRALDFLRLGYPGKCATKSSVVDFDDGLFLSERNHDGKYWLAADDLPIRFHGYVYELLERNSGHSRVLARRIKGTMDMKWVLPLALFEKRPTPVDAGSPVDGEGLLAESIGVSRNDLRNPVDPFPYDEVLIGIEQYFGRQQLVGSGASTLEAMAVDRWRNIALMEHTQFPARIQGRMLGLFASHDPLRVALGLSLYRAVTPPSAPGWAGADELLLDLIGIPVSGHAEAVLQSLLERQFRPERTDISPEVRASARMRSNDPGLKPWQRELLARIGGA
ncbi:hypothetical protein ACRAVF_32515 [Bradyrhizobium oligotrophicum S58]